MLNLFNYLLKDYYQRLTRRLFWFYKLSASNLGKSVTIEFPIVREGAGLLKLGEHSFLGRNCNLGISKNAAIISGTNTYIDTKSIIKIKTGYTLKMGNNFKLGESSRLYVQNHWQFGNDVKIETYCAIFAREPNIAGKFTVGNGTHIGDHTIIDLVNDVILGNEVAIGPNCTLYTHDHGYTNKNVAAWKGDLVSKPIIIQDGAWIGSNVTILPGVTIGKRAVIAAGSVVTKSIESESIYGGVPAKLIKKIE